MNKYIERLTNGIFKENPTFILMLGLCPTLAVTTSAKNGLGMGLTTTAVLVMSNLIISLLRKLIPNKVRIPSYIVVVATFVTIAERVLQAYIPSLNDSLGIYIPLIVVNCIILGRAEAYAAKNPIGLSAFDGIGMGLGFTVGLTFIGAFRELLGAGTVFQYQVTNIWGVGNAFSFIADKLAIEPITIFILAPGAFFVLAMLTALQNKLKLQSATNKEVSSTLSCGSNCSGCSGNTCTTNREKLNLSKNEVAAAKTVKKAAKEEKE